MSSPSRRVRLAAELSPDSLSGDLGRLLPIIKNGDIDGIEIPIDARDGIEPIATAAQIATAAARAKDAGLSTTGLILPTKSERNIGSAESSARETAIQDVLRALDLAASIGASVVTIGAGAVLCDDLRTPVGRYEDTFHFACRSLGTLRFEAASRCVRIAMRSCSRGFLLSPVDARDAVDQVNSPWVGLRLDPGTIVESGVPCDWATALGHRVFVLDYSDARRGAGSTPPGDGDTNWSELTRLTDSLAQDVFVSIPDDVHLLSCARGQLEDWAASSAI